MTDASAHVVASGVIDDGHAAAPHVSPRRYVMIAVVLAAVTAVEVAMSYADGVDTDLVIVMMIVLAAVKFLLVASWFMHLKFDSPVYRRLFIVGSTMAVILYFVVLLTFSVFSE
ncbi:MAG: cytochrome C oxidase subunit IV family protein [Acidimicrobiia bacterium]|nr:cytochrome C oxidase subunit IV family protein [Acidimicrobiia bacterium]